MRLLLWTISLATLLAGCASNPRSDIIGQVAQALARSQAEVLAKGYYRIFPAGIYTPLLLASNTPIPEITRAALKEDDWFASTNFNVVTARGVRICGAKELEASFDSDYTAVLVRTALGPRVVLLQFRQPQGSMAAHWWYRVYDPKTFLNQRGAGHGGIASSFHAESRWPAAPDHGCSANNDKTQQ